MDGVAFSPSRRFDELHYTGTAMTVSGQLTAVGGEGGWTVVFLVSLQAFLLATSVIFIVLAVKRRSKPQVTRAS
jgi:hypothetical protein